MNFSLKTYNRLLEALKAQRYDFLTFSQYVRKRSAGELLPEKLVILRHDVDKRAKNSTDISNIEYSQRIKATYFYRAWILNEPAELLKVKELGHEIGYHYEDLVTAHGDASLGIEYFEQNLKSLRLLASVTTICMHGSPKSKYDSKDLWKTADYHRFGIEGEPYFDMDLEDVCYLTDTGGCWDGYRFSVRDKMPPKYQRQWEANGWKYHTTEALIRAVEAGTFPPHAMLTTHPERWTDNVPLLCWNQAVQTAKNLIKYLLIRLRKQA